MRPDEEAPPFDAARAPRLPSADWPAERLAKARRNYAMDYVATILPETVRLFGPVEGGRLAGSAARLIGMQYHAATSELLGVGAAEGGAPAVFAEYLARMGRAQGDDTTWDTRGDGVIIRQTTWRLMEEAGAQPTQVFDAWTELWRGAALAHDPRLVLELAGRRDAGDARWEWVLKWR